MKRTHLSSVLGTYLGAVYVTAAEIVYVTDLSIFTSLAPCAASALSYNIFSLTYSLCGEAVSDLQSCACTKNQNLRQIQTDLSKSVSYSCGPTATADQASASTVLSAYCNQDSIPAFPTPATPVSTYITDIPEMSYLAPCASNAISAALNTMTYSACPPDATGLASCACSKNQNSLRISQLINTSGKYSCASHTADISSAQAMFAAYCALGNGTSSFPTPTNPPGDMTYYVTAMTQYDSLIPCAKSAVSYAVFSQTRSYCPNGPQALASCACLKDNLSQSITADIISNVRYSCDSTATEDITSAMAVFGLYCSAARNEVKLDVAESVTQTVPVGAGTPGPQTGAGPTSGTKPTGTNTKTGGTSRTTGATGAVDTSKPGGGTDPAGKKKKGASTGAIVGGVVGGIAVLAALGLLIFFLMRQSRRKRAEAEAAEASAARGDEATLDRPDHEGKPELGGMAIAAVPSPSPSPSTLKVNGAQRTEAVSPVTPNNVWTPPPQNQSELHGQGVAHSPNTAELGVTGAPPYPPNRHELTGQQYAAAQANHAELGNQGYNQHQVYPQAQNGGGQQFQPQEAHGQPIYEMQQQQQQQQQQAYRSGPYQEHYEADSRPLAGTTQQQPPQASQGPPQQAGWNPAELDGRYHGHGLG